MANIAAPWMVLVFLGFGLVGLRQLGVDSGGELSSAAQTVIWPGGDPRPRACQHRGAAGVALSAWC